LDFHGNIIYTFNSQFNLSIFVISGVGDSKNDVQFILSAVLWLMHFQIRMFYF